MTPQSARRRSPRFWVLTGAALVLSLIVAANGHLVFVALDSQPGCAEETTLHQPDGSTQILAPAKAGC